MIKPLQRSTAVQMKAEKLVTYPPSAVLKVNVAGKYLTDRKYRTGVMSTVENISWYFRVFSTLCPSSIVCSFKAVNAYHEVRRYE